VKDEVEQIWRVAVNVRSDDGSNDQAVAIDPMIGHPILNKLDAVAVGYNTLAEPRSIVWLRRNASLGGSTHVTSSRVKPETPATRKTHGSAGASA
jgi:uncharacterized protein YukJ